MYEAHYVFIKAPSDVTQLQDTTEASDVYDYFERIVKAKVLSLISWRTFTARSSLQITATGEVQPDQTEEGSHEACDVEENVRTVRSPEAPLDRKGWSLLLRMDRVLSQERRQGS